MQHTVLNHFLGLWQLSQSFLGPDPGATSPEKSNQHYVALGSRTRQCGSQTGTGKDGLAQVL